MTAKEPSKVLPIAVSMTARNEARNLPRSLGSVRDWVEEIMVVVNDCTDGTEETARNLGAKVFESKWEGYREQKNKALDRATQPWVLCLDADEEVSLELRAEIFRFFETEAALFTGGSFPRKTWFMGRWITHGDWYPDRVTRLFRKDAGRWEGTTEHCKVTIGGAVKKFRADLLHFSNPDICSHISKIPFYADTMLKRQIESGLRWSLAESVFRPWWRFFRAYVLRCGFLDGYPGYYIAKATAFATLVRYSRLYEHEANSRK